MGVELFGCKGSCKGLNPHKLIDFFLVGTGHSEELPTALFVGVNDALIFPQFALGLPLLGAVVILDVIELMFDSSFLGVAVADDLDRLGLFDHDAANIIHQWS